MNSQFDLSLVGVTISVASTRVLPDLLLQFSVKNLYDTIVALNPVVTAFWITPAWVFLQLALFVITGSVAWNDRFWTIIPPSYAFLYAAHPVISQDRRTDSSPDQRLALMAILVFTWSARLTYNAVRRGFYGSGFADYRYEWLRTNVVKNRFLFALLYVCNCCFLTVLLALASSPFYFAWVRRGMEPKLKVLDAVAAVGMLSCIILEAIADNQQHQFQAKKAAWRKRSEGGTGGPPQIEFSDSLRQEIRDGFLQSGLFGWSRHPNFFGEIGTWWFFYMFSVSASGRWLNWTMAGPLLYNGLFLATTPITEHISSSKYQAYKAYQRRVSRLIPSPFSKAVEVEKGSDAQEKKKN